MKHRSTLKLQRTSKIFKRPKIKLTTFQFVLWHIYSTYGRKMESFQNPSGRKKGIYESVKATDINYWVFGNNCQTWTFRAMSMARIISFIPI